MPRYVNDGNIKVGWATIANKNFPASSELLAGEDVECLLTKDGLNITFNENSVDDAALCETFDAVLPGSYGVSIELTLKRVTPAASDTAWNLFSTRGETGALVVRRGIDADTNWTTGDKVEVYPGTVGIRRPAAAATNEQGKFMVTIFGSEEPSLDATVVAS
jgi:hypothetical protein